MDKKYKAIYCAFSDELVLLGQVVPAPLMPKRITYKLVTLQTQKTKKKNKLLHRQQFTKLRSTRIRHSIKIKNKDIEHKFCMQHPNRVILDVLKN